MKQPLYLYIILFISCLINVNGQVEFKCTVNKTKLGLNEKLKVEFKVNCDADHFVKPNFDNFEVIFGPNLFIKNEWINKVSNYEKSYTFMLLPKKKGTFTLGSAKINFKGKTYLSKPIKITVTDPIKIPANPNDPRYILQEGVKLIAELSNHSPYPNQPMALTYKLYFKPNIKIQNVNEITSPNLKGFWSQEIDINTNRRQFKEVTLNSQKYIMVVWRKFNLYPIEQKPLTIDPLKISLSAGIMTGRRTIFFEPEYKWLNHQVSSSKKTVNVKPFPDKNKPDNFNQALGNFSLTLTPSKTKLKAGEALSLKVKISGTGNLKLLKLPSPKIPSAFELYDPEHKEKINSNYASMKGWVSDTYTLVPQYKGKYLIDPISFSFFDPKTNSYKTVKSNPIEINVTDGPIRKAQTENDSIEKTDKQTSSTDQSSKLTEQNTPFEFIKRSTKLTPLKEKSFFNNLYYLSSLITPFILLIILIIARKKSKRNKSTQLSKSVVHSKLAKKHLLKSKKLIDNNLEFYLALDKALHSFLKAKLTVETSEISKENIEHLLEEKGAESQTINQFIELMKNCEIARYTPSTSKEMQKDYQHALNLMTSIDKQI